jgi:hypothetical protein
MQQALYDHHQQSEPDLELSGFAIRAVTPIVKTPNDSNFTPSFVSEKVDDHPSVE